MPTGRHCPVPAKHRAQLTHPGAEPAGRLLHKLAVSARLLRPSDQCLPRQSPPAASVLSLGVLRHGATYRKCLIGIPGSSRRSRRIIDEFTETARKSMHVGPHEDSDQGMLSPSSVLSDGRCGNASRA